MARYGYAWVSLEEPVAGIPPVPEFGAPGWRTIFQFYEPWDTSPMRALENSFDNSHFSFVHRATFGVAAQPAPSKYEIVESETGFHAETVIPAANPEKFQRISGVSDAVTTRHMRNAYFLPFSRRLDIEYPSGIRHIIINCFTPIDDGRMQLCQWLFRNDTEADCPAQMLIDFDAEITREDKAILESTDPDAAIDPRRRGVEYSMDGGQTRRLVRKLRFGLLRRHAKKEQRRGTPARSALTPGARGARSGGALRIRASAPHGRRVTAQRVGDIQQGDKDRSAAQVLGLSRERMTLERDAIDRGLDGGVRNSVNPAPASSTARSSSLSGTSPPAAARWPRHQHDEGDPSSGGSPISWQRVGASRRTRCSKALTTGAADPGPLLNFITWSAYALDCTFANGPFILQRFPYFQHYATSSGTVARTPASAGARGRIDGPSAE